MAESRSDSLDELIANLSEEEFARAKECMERRDRETAPVETAPAPSARIGMFVPSSAPELRGRKNLAMFLERFYTWASVTGCDEALDSSTAPELMSHSTALTPFLPGHQATAIINRPNQPTDLRQFKPVLHQPSRCHRRRPDLSGRHLHRPLVRILIGASLPDHPKLYRHNTCLQASFRVRV